MNEDSITLQDACGCCAGVEPQTPMVVANRPGLSVLAYRVGTYVQFRSSMISELSSAQHPALGKLLTREPDDFSIALLDAFACMADVLTFYQERVANESYLRTATERQSLQEMARLVGYRLRPGVAAATYLAFTIDDAPGALGQASSTPTLPNANKEIPPVIPITIDIGTKVQSVPGPGEKAQTFETIEKIEARTEWNAIKPRLIRPQTLSIDMDSIFLQGTATNLKKGDIVLIVDDSGGSPEPRKILHVTLDEEAQTTRIDFEIPQPSLSPYYEGPSSLLEGTLDDFPSKVELDESVVLDIISKQWKEEVLSTLIKIQGWSADDLVANIAKETAGQEPAADTGIFVFRQRAAIFGHNAPYYESLLKPDGSYLYPNDWDTNGWEIWKDSLTNTYYSKADLYLERSLEGVVKDTWALLEKPTVNGPSRTIYKIRAVSEASLAGFGMSGKSTGLKLAKLDGSSLANDTYDKPPDFMVRTTSVYLQSEQLALADLPIEDVVEEDTITLDRTYLGLKVGHTVILTGERNDLKGIIACEIMSLKEVIIDAGFTVLTFDQSLAHSYVRSTVTINANVAQATHGETVQEILGSGDASRAFQRFELKQSPLTYVSADNPSGADSTLKMRVNDIQWHEVSTLYGKGAQERIFTTKAVEDGKTIVTFGDGVNGERLPSGQENVRAVYRKGIGMEGNVAANTLSQLMTRPLGLKAVTNPKQASGGTSPESSQEARRNIPIGIRTLGRAVSLLDYEDFARSFTGIAKSHAAVLTLHAGRTIFVTVAGEQGAVFDADDKVLINLSEALRNSGDPLVRVEVGPYRPASFGLIINVKRDPDHEWETVSTAVKTALHTAFSFEAREFGQPVLRSEVIAVVQRTPGVVAVDIDSFYRSVPSLEDRLLADLATVELGNPVAAEILTLSSDRLDVQEMS